jgi:hypothetical protein
MRLILYIKGILPPILKSLLSPLLINLREYEFKSIYKNRFLLPFKRWECSKRAVTIGLPRISFIPAVEK